MILVGFDQTQMIEVLGGTNYVSWTFHRDGPGKITIVTIMKRAFVK